MVCVGGGITSLYLNPMESLCHSLLKAVGQFLNQPSYVHLVSCQIELRVSLPEKGGAKILDAPFPPHKLPR